ncbi:MAG TPA: hypothetical protein VGO06_00335 [Bosea sp. (in: a-proteobacteria)]|uniref:hypothetical protein n=1 Tax=Bosea sp. (in: a-proteobacteria) TaxID=1871050 RepID=UPI002E12E4B1|nr:hypothetical protein [Bosea sp. (in: a-proteobacteria)]
MRRGQGLLAVLLLAGAATASEEASAQASPERLQGAWATNAATCDQVFTKRTGRLVFNKNSAEGWSGFIATGKHIRSPNASCDVISSKQKGDVLTFLLGCESEIIFENVSVSVRFKPDGGLVRFDPEFPEVETPYHRCDG